MDLRLRPLRIDDEAAARTAHAELKADGFGFLLFWQDGVEWPGYVAMQADWRRGERLPAGMVRSALLVAESDGELVGRSSIRFELNGWLARFGGHIGYGVRPAHRRRGYATEILRQSLIVARAEGVQRVLVTCDVDNVPSARTIERCGGVLEDVVGGPDGGAPKRRYWID